MGRVSVIYIYLVNPNPGKIKEDCRQSGFRRDVDREPGNNVKNQVFEPYPSS